jgi:hypothetical protein
LAPQVQSFVKSVMIRKAYIVVIAILTCWVLCYAQSNPAGSNAGSQPKTKSDPKATKSEPKGQQTSLTGCIDEQDGKWVLVNDKTMAVIANLAADGFPTEGFAKHVGQKVTVRGTTSSDGPGPLFKVRLIETISETCAAR